MADIPPIKVTVTPVIDDSLMHCEVCAAVVTDMDEHKAWHRNVTDFVQQRARGLENRVHAVTDQGRAMLEEQAQRITGLNEAFVNDRDDQRSRIAGVENSLTGMFARLRGVEDELTKREVQQGLRDEPPVQGNVVRNLTGSVVMAELEVADGIYRVVDARVRPLSVGPELPDGTYTVQGQRVIDIQPSFPQQLATCEECYWSKGELTLCSVHTAVVDAARHETHAE